MNLDLRDKHVPPSGRITQPKGDVQDRLPVGFADANNRGWSRTKDAKQSDRGLPAGLLSEV